MVDVREQALIEEYRMSEIPSEEVLACLRDLNISFDSPSFGINDLRMNSARKELDKIAERKEETLKLITMRPEKNIKRAVERAEETAELSRIATERANSSIDEEERLAYGRVAEKARRMEEDARRAAERQRAIMSKKISPDLDWSDLREDMFGDKPSLGSIPEGSLSSIMKALDERGFLSDCYDQTDDDLLDLISMDEFIEKEETSEGVRWHVTPLGQEYGIIQANGEQTGQSCLKFTELAPWVIYKQLDMLDALVNIDKELERQFFETIQESRRRSAVESLSHLHSIRLSRVVERQKLVQLKEVRKEAIKKVIEDRGIQHLYHYTQAQNLNDIFIEGLLSRNRQNAYGLQVAYNDSERLDGHLEGTSLSISWPNYKLLYKVMQKAKGQSLDEQFVIIELDSSVLYKADCAFFPTNAARQDMVAMDVEKRKTARALEELFEDTETYKRAEHELEPFYPTDPQAEVLAFQPIYDEDITAVYFETEEMLEEFGEDPRMRWWDERVNKEIFERRKDWKAWYRFG